MFVKVCGVTNEDDALLAVAMGADAVGFVFAPSPRQVHPEVVRDIVKRLPPEILTVGVFRNETPERVVDVVGRTGLKGAQLHGGETAEDLRLVRLRVPFVIQALPAGDARLAGAGAGPESADVVLIDSQAPGSGEVFDWSLAEGAPDGVRLLLAGGLNPDNVEQAIRKVRPWGVDAASGLEASPGRKDATKVRLFIARAREAAKALEEGWTPSADGPYDWAEDGT
ncbi:MAG TPA: phosphoribosylanthranilate isomerase [Acidimicrobiia bacterium]|nr:phosphoribosylanthranilate isomerase [Acidimicrobiia bacterium]HZQ75886.1 phosphoribosylanthranilate isomerase [Acidimicrobiia bacterium]